ncbi:hypothetical protein EYA84_18110 [Verrucosispora sp. SN26_14.1]|uniref:hypothetical protein n=1 Tax=Verrucosispora sp. SN26_14.1 TaxID=2527879 RepID=UPI0010F10958|nr:hypothetical protein [Verrucosispora sp. SN26_14.1]TBL33095.1 hypothetical protein EYA84_18110 [Verrucosispora sp. SN26_14.1]
MAGPRHSRDVLGGAFPTLAPDGVNALRASGLSDGHGFAVIASDGRPLRVPVEMNARTPHPG